MRWKVVLEFGIAAFGVFLMGAGIMQLVRVLLGVQAVPGGAYGASNLIGRLLPILAGAILCLSMHKRLVADLARAGFDPDEFWYPSTWRELFASSSPLVATVGTASPGPGPDPSPDPAPGHFRFACPTCGRSFEKPVALAGQPGRCKTCQAIFTIPTPPPALAVPPAPSAPPAPRPLPASARPAWLPWVGGGAAAAVVVLGAAWMFWSSDGPGSGLIAAGSAEPPAKLDAQDSTGLARVLAQSLPRAAKPVPVLSPSPSAPPAPSTAASPALSPAGRFDEYPGAGAADWFVLFRGTDPAAWNTRAQGETFAVPLGEAPEGARFLRLKRLDTGESLIVPITRDGLGRAVGKGENPDASVRWCGTNKKQFGSRHLGIAEAPFVVGSTPEAHGALIVQVEFFDGYSGSGFGHLGYGDESIQHFGWRGRPIPPTPFEIAVTTADLQPAP